MDPPRIGELCVCQREDRTRLHVGVGDLDAAIGALVAAGARPLRPRAAGERGDSAEYVADPDGDVVAAAAPTRVS